MGLARVNLRILVDEETVNQDRVLAIVRDSGMLITDTWAHASYPDLAHGEFSTNVVRLHSQLWSVCRRIRARFSERLRGLAMIRFPDYADEEERKDVRDAIRALGRWIRQEIEKLAKPPEPSRFDNASEVAEFLPLPGEGSPGQSRGAGEVEISQPRLRNIPPAGLGLPSRARRGRDTRPGGDDPGGGGRRNGATASEAAE